MNKKLNLEDNNSLPTNEGNAQNNEFSNRILVTLEGKDYINSRDGKYELKELEDIDGFFEEDDKPEIIERLKSILKSIDNKGYGVERYHLDKIDYRTNYVELFFEEGVSYSDIQDLFPVGRSRTKSEDGTYFGGGGTFTKNRSKAEIGKNRVVLTENLTSKGVTTSLAIWFYNVEEETKRRENNKNRTQ